MACPGSCADCCYEIRVYIYYLSGDCPEKYACSNYNGIWTLTQQGATGIDCTWLYTDPVDGFTIRIHCEDGYWLLTIQNGETICAQWRYALAGYP